MSELNKSITQCTCYTFGLLLRKPQWKEMWFLTEERVILKSKSKHEPSKKLYTGYPSVYIWFCWRIVINLKFWFIVIREWVSDQAASFCDACLRSLFFNWLEVMINKACLTWLWLVIKAHNFDKPHWALFYLLNHIHAPENLKWVDMRNNASAKLVCEHYWMFISVSYYCFV